MFRISSLFLKTKQFTEEDLKACALETAKITHSGEGRVIVIFGDFLCQLSRDSGNGLCQVEFV
jgi:hypothetical protein